MACEACSGTKMERWLGPEQSEEVGPCSVCQVVSVWAEPSRAAVLDFASRALRNAPDGTVTAGLLNALCDDIKDGLKSLDVKHKK